MSAAVPVPAGHPGRDRGERGGQVRVTRERQDQWALRSHRLAADARDAGWFDAEIVPVRRAGLTPLSRYVGSAAAGVHPDYMAIGPLPAMHKALGRAGWRLDEVGLIEVNEAFAAQSVAVVDELKADPALVNVNVNGGAIAIRWATPEPGSSPPCCTRCAVGAPRAAPPRWNIEPVICGSMRHRTGCAPGRRAPGFRVCGDPGASGTAVASVMAARTRSRLSGSARNDRGLLPC
jgi:hypothetical protein